MKRYGWLLGLLVLAGCDDEEPSGATPDAAVRDAAFGGRDFSVRDAAVVDQGTPGCARNEDCGENEVCVNGECLDERPMPECLRDEDCEAGQVCGQGACIEGPECVEDADCGNGRACEGGTCVEAPPPPDCVEDADCANGQVCRAGACVDGPPPPDCVRDADCGAGRVCEAGACVDAPPPPDCVQDADCPAGQTCQAGACVAPPPECRGNADCGAGRICVNGACEDAPPPPACQANADCGPGEICVDGVCELAPPPACDADADCPPGLACVAGVCRAVAGDCGDAVRVGFGPTPGTTLGAGNGFSGSCGGEDGPDAVFELALDQAGVVCVDTFNADFDTVLYARTGDCVAGAELDCNDDSDLIAGLQSSIEIEVRDAAPVFVFVDGFDVEAGDFVLNVTAGPCGGGPVDCLDDADCGAGEVCIAGACQPDVPPACADDFDCDLGEICVAGACQPDAAPCVDDLDCDLGEICVAGACVVDGGGAACDAEVALVNGEARGSTVGAPAADRGSCGGAGEEIAHTFVAPAAGTFCARTEGSDYDTVVYVRTDCADAASELGCNDDADGTLQSAVEFEAEAGATYHVFVDGFAGAGDYVLTVTPGVCEGPAPDCFNDFDCAADELCVDGVCVPDAPADCLDDADCPAGEICVAGACAIAAGGTCDAPFIVEAFGETQGTLAGDSGAVGSCGGNGPEAVYAFAVDAPGELCLSTAGSPIDTVLYVRAGDCLDGAAELDCSDDAVGLTSEISLPVEADVTYFVFVDSFRVEGGDYVLSVTDGPCGGPPPACVENADCAAGEICQAGACVPAGDIGTCDAPIPVEAFGPVDGTTIGAGSVAVGSCGGNGPEAVHALVVDGPGEVCISTAGSGFDTVVHVRAGVCDDAMAEVACNDDAVGLQSELTLAVEGDVPYFIFVDGFAGAGDYTLTITPGPCGEVPPACVDDADCAAGEICEAGACVPAAVNGTCDAPNPVAAFGELRGSTNGAPAVAGASCGGGATGPEAVYVFALNGPGDVCVSTAGSAFDTVLHVRAGDCADAAGEVGCNDDAGGGLQSELTIAAEANVPYFVFVDGFNGANGDYVLTITPGACGAAPPACAVDADCGAGETCQAGVCVAAPVGDGTCDSPIGIEALGALNGATDGVGVEGGSCGGGPASPEAVYAFAVDQATPICLTTAGSDFDTVLYVRTDCGDPASEVACNDDAVGLTSQVDVLAEPDQVYFVFVDGFTGAVSTNNGDYVLNVSVGPCP